MPVLVVVETTSLALGTCGTTFTCHSPTTPVPTTAQRHCLAIASLLTYNNIPVGGRKRSEQPEPGDGTAR